MTIEQFDKLESGLIFRQGIDFLGERKIVYVAIKYYPLWSLYWMEADDFIPPANVIIKGIKASRTLAEKWVGGEIMDLYND